MEAKFEDQDRDVTNAVFKTDAGKTRLSIPPGGFPGCWRLELALVPPLRFCCVVAEHSLGNVK